jgi:large subunit ribosomal protein L9
MKILLLKDVYKLGRAGDVKRVADGYGRNFLLPQGLAVLATPGALKQAEQIRAEADTHREKLNQEMSAVAARLDGMVLTFPARASETGKLYGSITAQMVAEAISRKGNIEISRRQVDIQPLRNLGEHKAHVRLTVDLVPEITVLVHREGETPTLPSAVAVEAEVAEEELELEAAMEPEEEELEPEAAEEPEEEGAPEVEAEVEGTE